MISNDVATTNIPLMSATLERSHPFTHSPFIHVRHTHTDHSLTVQTTSRLIVVIATLNFSAASHHLYTLRAPVPWFDFAASGLGLSVPQCSFQVGSRDPRHAEPSCLADVSCNKLNYISIGEVVLMPLSFAKQPNFIHKNKATY